MNYVGMKKYVGMKIINARPCTADEADEIIGRKVCRDNADADGNGYLVKYKDGYTSWSPAAPFEEAYRPISMVSFGIATEMMKEGKKVTRTGWNGKGMYLELQTPDENSKMSMPYIYIRTVYGDFVPWVASQTDLLAEDWAEAETV